MEHGIYDLEDYLEDAGDAFEELEDILEEQYPDEVGDEWIIE